jgi:hypothetical protein
LYRNSKKKSTVWQSTKLDTNFCGLRLFREMLSTILLFQFLQSTKTTKNKNNITPTIYLYPVLGSRGGKGYFRNDYQIQMTDFISKEEFATVMQHVDDICETYLRKTKLKRNVAGLISASVYVAVHLDLAWYIFYVIPIEQIKHSLTAKRTLTMPWRTTLRHWVSNGKKKVQYHKLIIGDRIGDSIGILSHCCGRRSVDRNQQRSRMQDHQRTQGYRDNDGTLGAATQERCIQINLYKPYKAWVKSGKSFHLTCLLTSGQLIYIDESMFCIPNEFGTVNMCNEECVMQLLQQNPLTKGRLLFGRRFQRYQTIVTF